MATKTYRGKCPRCCPDGGACFTRVYDYDTGRDVKQCNNCGQQVTLRKVNRNPEAPNQRQTWTVERIQGYGWVLKEQKMIGRKLWVSFDHPTKNWLLGNQVFGTISPRGRLALKLMSFGGDKDIKDDVDEKVYLQ